VVYVEFNNTFERNDSFQTDFFSDVNMSSMLNLAIEMMLDVIKTGKLVVQKLGWEKTRSLWVQVGNPLYKFTEDNMIKGGETAFTKQNLMYVLQQWCKDTKAMKADMIPSTLSELNDMVDVLGGKVDSQRRFDNGSDDMTHCYTLPFSWRHDTRYERLVIKCLTNRDASPERFSEQLRLGAN
jgi:hypothetical protein